MLQEAEAALAAEIERLARAEQVTVATRSLARFEPVEFDPATIDLVERDRAAPRLLDAPDAERRRPRRPDARPGLPDGDDLHAERERAVAQHRRVHRSPTTSRPAPTCCYRRILALAGAPHDAVGGPERDRLA